MNPVLIVLPILTVLMFDLGLTLAPADFKTFVRRPAPVLTGLAGQLIILPLTAFVLCMIFRPDPVIFTGIMLIACSPGGSSSNIFSKIAGGDVALSVTLTAFSSVITVFTIPFVMELSILFAGFSTDAPMDIPASRLLMQNIVLMLLPIILGAGLRRWKPAVAQKTDKVLSKAAFPCLMLLAAIFFVEHYRVILDNIGSIGLILSLLILAAMSAGGLLGRAMKLNISEKRTIVIEVGMQNAAQSIALASSPFVFNNDTMAIPAIIYALLMNVILLTYVAFCKRRMQAKCI